MNSIWWTLIVVAIWFVLNLIGTFVNRSSKFVWLQQSGDVPVQKSGPTRTSVIRTDTRTSGKLVVHRPAWLRIPARAVNNMRTQAPYLAAVMALAWWIERMWP